MLINKICDMYVSILTVILYSVQSLILLLYVYVIRSTKCSSSHTSFYDDWKFVFFSAVSFTSLWFFKIHFNIFVYFFSSNITFHFTSFFLYQNLSQSCFKIFIISSRFVSYDNFKVLSIFEMRAMKCLLMTLGFDKKEFDWCRFCIIKCQLRMTCFKINWSIFFFFSFRSFQRLSLKSTSRHRCWHRFLLKNQMNNLLLIRCDKRSLRRNHRNVQKKDFLSHRVFCCDLLSTSTDHLMNFSSNFSRTWQSLLHFFQYIFDRFRHHRLLSSDSTFAALCDPKIKCSEFDRMFLLYDDCQRFIFRNMMI